MTDSWKNFTCSVFKDGLASRYVLFDARFLVELGLSLGCRCACRFGRWYGYGCALLDFSIDWGGHILLNDLGWRTKDFGRSSFIRGCLEVFDLLEHFL